jgi:hypothetical protein
MEPPKTEKQGFAAPALKDSAINRTENFSSLPANASIVKKEVYFWSQQAVRNTVCSLGYDTAADSLRGISSDNVIHQLFQGALELLNGYARQEVAQ